MGPREAPCREGVIKWIPGDPHREHLIKWANRGLSVVKVPLNLPFGIPYREGVIERVPGGSPVVNVLLHEQGSPPRS